MITLLLFTILFSLSVSSIQHSGYIEVDKTYGANLFYLIYESKNNPEKDPVVLWLQGGPGCSSLFGAFIENGPMLIQSDGSFKVNPYSWNTNATVIYIDSPVGSGYSYVKSALGYATNEKTIADELYVALYEIFFELYPKMGNVPFYIFGESYAGKYVPWLASTILARNENAEKQIKLSGVGIGDGWVNPYSQTASYAPFLYANGLINEAELDVTLPIVKTYQGLIDLGLYIPASIVGNDLLEFIVVMGGVGDVYDIRKASDPTDPLNDALTTYLNTPEVQKQFNAASSWQGCAIAPNFALMSDEARSSEILLPKILQKIPVLLYNGNYDLICNYMGTAEYVQDLDWPNQTEFNNAKNQTWTVSNKPAGYYKTADLLTLLVVYNAGHMVPFDQPENSHDLLYRFIQNKF